MAPETFLRVLGPNPYRVGYVQPSRRPADGRYGENPNRLFKHMQYQVILKPPPADVQDLYLASLSAIGIDLRKHDIKFEEDNWESPTLGAWGIGWQVMLDGLEITQFTYFQQCGGIDLDPISAELTYGLERIAAFLQDVDSIYDITWVVGPDGRPVKYGEIRLQDELQFSVYNFEHADVAKAWEHLKLYESECQALLDEYNAAYVVKRKAKSEKPDSGEERKANSQERLRFPVLGAFDDNGTLLGFASYGSFRAWPAYQYTIEHSIYVRTDRRKQGLGKLLLGEIVAAAKSQDYHMMIGVIDGENAVSIALHKRSGFAHCASIKHAGYKFGHWLDLEFYQLILPTPANPTEG